MMIGPSTITRLIQITGRTEVVQTVSEIDFIARLQPDNPNTPVQPRQQRTDQNTPQGKTPEHRPRAEQDTIVGRQASAQTNPPTAQRTGPASVPPPLGRAGTLQSLTMPPVLTPQAMTRTPTQPTPPVIASAPRATSGPMAAQSTQFPETAAIVTAIATAVGQLTRLTTQGDAAPPQTPFVPQTANPPSAGAPPLALNTAGLGPGAGPVVGTETGANVGTIPQPAGTTVVNPPPPLPQPTGPNATPITQGQTAQPTPPMQVSTSPTSPTMPNASAGALPTPSASSGQPAPTTAATVQTQIAPPINNTVSQSVSQTQNIPQTVINPAVPPLAAAGAVPSAPIMPIPQQTPQDVTWLLAVNAALVPGWPNVTGQLQNIVKQQQSVKDALETAAHQLRNMSPDQRAMALAQLGLPRHAFAIIERLARRLAKSLENDIPPDLVVGFLIALLTTLGHVSDALRYVDSILRNADAG